MIEYKTINKTYEIPEQNLPSLKEKLDKVNKKCAKLGFPPFEVKVISISSNTEDTFVYRILTIEISGTIPKIAGYTFCGSIQHLQNSEDNIVKEVKETKIPDKFRNRRCCDHCNINRYRTETYILKSNNGNYFQVGSSCLKDFLGHDPESGISICQYIIEIEEKIESFNFDSGALNKTHLYLPTFLKYVAFCIRNYGWVSKKESQETGKTSTVFQVFHVIDLKEKNIFSDSDIRIAEQSLEWAKSLSDRLELSSYLWNIHAIAKSELIERRLEGYAASIIIAWSKDTGNTPDGTEKQEPRKKSDFVGTVGCKETFFLKCIKVARANSLNNFGSSNLVIFIDANDNIIKWFQSGNAIIEENAYYSVIATVKDHSTYNNNRETLITRPRCNLVLDEAKIKDMFKPSSLEIKGKFSFLK